MLTVYTYRDAPKPASPFFDFSELPLNEWVTHATSIVQHHTEGRVWLGYLDGWMLTSQEETLLRPLIRKFSCFVVSAFPFALPLSWKNELTEIVVSEEAHGAPRIDDNGSTLHNRSESTHRQSCERLATNTLHPED